MIDFSCFLTRNSLITDGINFSHTKYLEKVHLERQKIIDKVILFKIAMEIPRWSWCDQKDLDYYSLSIGD